MVSKEDRVSTDVIPEINKFDPVKFMEPGFYVLDFVIFQKNFFELCEKTSPANSLISLSLTSKYLNSIMLTNAFIGSFLIKSPLIISNYVEANYISQSIVGYRFVFVYRKSRNLNLINPMKPRWSFFYEINLSHDGATWKRSRLWKIIAITFGS